ncbi:transcription factor HES-5-like isoform X2 [Sceloporus undulatus]|uniref:transcription factor HES-5-like isoform X2 n=1 Tax=Sceloporus undulatus TaxID=8520 RepID=UPI001C4D955E|nr:transcription factor HES-5-like isoform X2 [Sceloporus undulatus]XP_042334674.1 transcription factor HES-5-like isoform X2 [Sceloporus undulatus]
MYKWRAGTAHRHCTLLARHPHLRSHLLPWRKRMAPSGMVFMDPNSLLTPKEKNKLRKPVVEKMRRDRINSSIEQLKLLLEKEFQRHQPNSKLEKADILEMTVDYLKQQSQLQAKVVGPAHKDTQVDFKQGYSRCLHEAFQFMSLHKVHTETQAKLVSHFQCNQLSTSEVMSSPSLKSPPSKNIHTLWRPW